MSLRPLAYKEAIEGMIKPVPLSNEIRFTVCDDITIAITTDIEREQVQFQVEMPIGSHLAFGFGARLEDCDMLLFQAEMEDSHVLDCYYQRGDDKYIDDQQDWTSEVIDFGSRHYKMMTARRALDTGDSNDFMFQLDKEMMLTYTYDLETSEYKHGMHFKKKETLLLLSDGQAYHGWGELFDQRRVGVYESHGLWMFFAWMPLGYLLLATKRYLKGNWKLWHVLHILGGLLILVITVWQTLEISMKFGWGWTDDVHSILGTICIAGTFFSVLSGTLAAAVMRCYDGDQDWAKKEMSAIIGKIHRWSSYILLFYANVIILGGTITYCMTYIKDSKFIPLGIISFMLFINIVLVSEILHRKKARSENLASQQRDNDMKANDNNGKGTMWKRYTAQQMDIEVEKGEKLFVLDNLVLDTNGYERQHPGGKFTMIKNFGRDVSKFYYGGYALVQEKGAYGVYTHSEMSRQVVKQMIVGYMAGQEDVQDVTTTIASKYCVNEATATFVMKAINNSINVNWRNWFSDVQMIGKHFLLYSSAVRDVKRHYTICNVMIPDNRTELIALCNNIVRGQQINLNGRLFGDQDQSSICVTVKNYRGPKGVSTQLFDAVADEDMVVVKQLDTEQPLASDRGLLDQPDADDWSPVKPPSPLKNPVKRSDDIFFVKGPMGKGLQIEERGDHLAFCAGTGVLVYLDLIGHLILRNSLPFIRHNSRDQNTSNLSFRPLSDFSYLCRDTGEPNALPVHRDTKIKKQLAGCQSNYSDEFPEKAYSVLSDHFRFHLYVSFQNEQSAIGLDLVNALLDLNKKLRLNNFKFTVRYSEPKKDPDSEKMIRPRRWDKAYIQEELYPLKGKISRIWVCGPPVMNQCFDQALEDMQEKLQLRSNQIEIM